MATMSIGRFGKLPLEKFCLASRNVANVHDPYAVAVLNRCHCWPCASCHILSLLGKEGTIQCQVTGTRQYSVDLPQGGLEVPCKLTFSGETRLIIKVRKLVQEALDSGLLTSGTVNGDPQ